MSSGITIESIKYNKPTIVAIANSKETGLRVLTIICLSYLPGKYMLSKILIGMFTTNAIKKPTKSGFKADKNVDNNPVITPQ